MGDNNIIVLVHPYESEVYDSQPSFNAARERIMQTNSPLVILTNKPKETARRIPQKRSYHMFKTEEANPKPKVGWKTFSEYLKQLGQSAIFCGAGLHYNSQGKLYTGCVLEAFERANIAHKRIEPSLCWIGE